LGEILELVAGSVDLRVSVEPVFARGLEYYTGMVFEVYIPQLDIALGGGGRYDRLIEVFGGTGTPAVGCAQGIDRVAIALQEQKIGCNVGQGKSVAIVPITEALKVEALKIAQYLRGAGVVVEFEVMGRKMGRALEDADRRQLDYVVIVGERELKDGSVVLKNLATRQQAVVAIKELAEKIRG
jgi:histidyl-tRNA synthetase